MTPSEGLRYDTVSFMSDYGCVDEFVGVVHSVIRSLAPGVGVIDITHELAPYDVRAGGLTLARSAQYLCPGVVLAVVDPGVGSTRRAVAVEVGDGSSVLIGPDNGLLAPAVALVGGATRAVVLDNAEHHLPSPGPTFDGRDVFAPVAAALCMGTELSDLGTEIDPVSLLPATLALSRSEGDSLVTEVLWVDRFGNVQLNLDPEELDALGEHFELEAHGNISTAPRVTAFEQVPAGGLGLLVDSYGLVALVARQAAAGEIVGVLPGDEVRLRATAPGRAAAQEIRVELGSRPDKQPPDHEHGSSR